VKDVHDWTTVHRLYKQGTPIKKIARDLGISKNTVKKLIKLDKEPKYSREYYATKIDPYKDNIKEWYLNPKYDFNGTRIFRELKKIGYSHSINPIYRYLRTLKEDKMNVPKKATVRIETPIGDQAQFDWSPYKVEIANEWKEVYCFTMILAACRKKAIVFSLKSDAEAIYEAIQELYDDLGGVTQELLIDNPKALVLKNEPDQEPVFNVNALRLAMHLGTELNACQPYRARTKGKIEKPYQYIEEQFIKGSSFESMESLNKAGKAFINEWNDQVHGTTKRIPNEMFKEEKNLLLTLQNERFIHTVLKDRKVSLDALVSVNGNKYSVPVKYVDKIVKIRIVYGYKLEIYNTAMEMITTYELINEKGKFFTKDEHYAPIKQPVPKSIPEVKRQFESIFKFGESYFVEATKVLQQPSYHAREILKLKDMYHTENLDKILNYCIKEQKFKINEIKEIIREKYLEIVLGRSHKENTKDIGTLIECIDEIATTDALIRDTSYYEGGQI
jgi:transposase